jgi:competence protein ComEC
VSYIKKNWQIFLLILLTVVNLAIWLSLLSTQNKDFVKVSFLDVGQGDAIFIEGRNGNQIMLDGGPGSAALRKLPKVMPIFDRSIDVLIETHPDADHIGGFPEVIKRYKVGMFFEPGVESDNSIDDEIKRRLQDKKIPTHLARKGMVLDFGDGSYLEILFPDRDVSGLETNDASVIAKYVYGNTCFVLTGDAPSKMEEYLVSKKVDLDCQVLKAGHHGSRTSTSETFVSAVSLEYTVISAGKDNAYGHPHAEVMERLKAHEVKILNTAAEGTIKMISDGERVFVK